VRTGRLFLCTGLFYNISKYRKRKGTQMKKPYTIRKGREVWRNHFRYDWWRYVGLVTVAVLLWSMVSAALNKIPEEERVDIYLLSDYADAEALEELSAEMLPDFPELKEINFVNIPLGGEEEYLYRQKLVVNIAASEGDIFIGSEEEMAELAKQGLFDPLEESWEANPLSSYIPQEDLALYLAQADTGGEPHYYGASAEKLRLLSEYFYDPAHKVMGVPYYSVNKEIALRVMVWLIEHSAGE